MLVLLAVRTPTTGRRSNIRGLRDGEEILPLINRTAAYLLLAGVILDWLASAVMLISLSDLGSLRDVVASRDVGGRVVRVANELGLMTLMLGASLPWMCNGPIVDASGVGLRVWGRLRWMITWDRLEGWCWENDLDGNETGLVLHDRRGQRRGVRMAPFGGGYGRRRTPTNRDMANTYLPVLKAIENVRHRCFSGRNWPPRPEVWL